LSAKTVRLRFWIWQRRDFQ